MLKLTYYSFISQRELSLVTKDEWLIAKLLNTNFKWVKAIKLERV